MPFDREMQRALDADGEKLRQLTGEDHGPEFLTLAICDVCGGEGCERRSISVYEHGCGFPHDDVYEIPCAACDGTGEVIVSL